MDEHPDWEGLFDFSTRHIQGWEVENIRTAERQREIVLPPYAVNRCLERDIPPPDVFSTIRNGKPFEKEPPTHPERKPGIAFRRGFPERTLKVKVGYLGRRYSVVTVHDK